MSDNPDITLAIDAILRADPDVADITTQLFVNRLPQGVSGRAIVFWVISETPLNHLGGAVGMDQALVELDAYGANPGQAHELAWRIWRALDAKQGVFAEVQIHGATRNSGVTHTTDRTLAGTDKYRFVALQTIRFTYRSLAKVV